MKLHGLTVVLIDNGPDVATKYEPAMNLALESFLALKEIGSDVRIFSVSDRLVELLEMPEAFALSFRKESRIAAAVNRVNILKPRRIVVIAAVPPWLGTPREGTRGYLWHAQQELIPTAGLDGWQPIFADARGIISEIALMEKGAGRGAEQTSVR